MTSDAAALLRGLQPGVRVVVRYRIDGGFTDALGTLTDIGKEECTVSTRRGHVVIAYPLVTAAKPVPPAPPRRPARARPL
ncbi:hypothetical protein N2K95_12100 [Arthrobacter zhaoxinii]|uniref:Histone acetyltransferase Rv0428c-like SH3 domain-containing protein n=1 Tax=Arthrobacter zhaoxinii TaxID=2964616 RepID=A0ABY5YMT2_9MICC|nr:hypothetical protein [Arthrobacter zhaoxinii]UWX96400.1 hypothetical protein N2K95_12100 [Arthrobacter zhaoxinii]